MNKESEQHQSKMSAAQKKHLEQIAIQKEIELKQAQIDDYKSKSQLNTAKMQETEKKGFKAEKEALAKDMDVKEKQYNLEKQDAEAEDKEEEKEAQRMQALSDEEKALRARLYGDPNSVAPNTPEEAQSLMEQKKALFSGQPQAQAPQAQPVARPQVPDVPAAPVQAPQAPAMEAPSAMPNIQAPEFPDAPQYESMAPVDPEDFANQQLDEYEIKAKETMIKVEAQNRRKKLIFDTFTKARDESVRKMMGIENQLKDLRENTPTYKEAIKKIPGYSKGMAIASAFFLGLAGDKNPQKAMDDLIKMSYDDDVLKHETAIKGLKSERTLIKDIMEIDADTYSKQLLYENEILKSIMQGLKIQGNLVQNEQTKIKNQQVIKQMQDKVVQNKNLIQEKMNQHEIAKVGNEWKKKNLEIDKWKMKEQSKLNRFKAQTTALQARTAQLNAVTAATNAKTSQIKANIAKFKAENPQLDTKDIVTIYGGLPVHKSLVGKTLESSKNSVKTIRKANRLLGFIDPKSKLKGLTKEEQELKKVIQSAKGDTVLTKFGKRFLSGIKRRIGVEDQYAQIQNLLFAEITEAVLPRRIDVSGGGNMNEQERRALYTLAGLTIPEDVMELSNEEIKNSILDALTVGTLRTNLKSMRKNAYDGAVRDLSASTNIPPEEIKKMMRTSPFFK